MKKRKVDINKITRSVLEAYRKPQLPYQIKIEPSIKETSHKAYGVTLSVEFGDKKFGKRIRSVVESKGLYLSCELKEVNHGSYFKPDIQKRLVCSIKEMPDNKFFGAKMELCNLTNTIKQIPILSKTSVIRHFDTEYARDAFIQEVKPTIELFFKQHYLDYQGLVREAEAPVVKEEAEDKHLAGVEEAIQFLKDNPDLPQRLREPLEKTIHEVRNKKANEETVEEAEERQQEVEAIINALKLTHKLGNKK